MKTWLLAVAALATACGGTSAGAGASATPSRSVASATATPATTVTPSPSASPSGLSSAKGFITVREPLPNARVSSPFVIGGDASVFEATLQWRVTDTAGRVLAQGTTTASAGAPGRGAYTITATFARPASDTIAIVEVFDRSPRDGSVDEIVRVPVVIAP